MIQQAAVVGTGEPAAPRQVGGFVRELAARLRTALHWPGRLLSRMAARHIQTLALQSPSPSERRDLLAIGLQPDR